MSFQQRSQPSYGGCDSFFVQSDDGLYPTAEHRREQDWHVAHVQHLQIEEELSKHTAMEYQEEILAHMHCMEVN